MEKLSNCSVSGWLRVQLALIGLGDPDKSTFLPALEVRGIQLRKNDEYIDYAASKGAIGTLTKGLSLEVAAENIRVNCVRPSCIYTDMHADGGETGRVDRLADVLPMKRGGHPEEVA